jgi:hypothetical protein
MQLWTVTDTFGVVPGEICPTLGVFTSEEAASSFIETLIDPESGRYGLDGPGEIV